MYRKKALSSLLVMLVIFACIFLVGLANFIRGQAILGLGLGQAMENGLVMAFSLLALLRVIFELFRM